MSNVAQIRRKGEAGDDQQDPLRQALKAAIEAEAEACDACVAADEALERGRAVVGAADAELERARGLVTAARERDSRATAAAVRRSAAGAPDASTTRKARAAVADAEDLLEVAQGACERLKQDCAEKATAALWARNRVLEARAALLAPVFATMLENAAAARMLLATSTAVLIEFLNRDRPGPDFGADTMSSMAAREARDKPLVEITQEAKRFITHAISNGEDDAARAAVRTWHAAVAALAGDPSVELPPGR